MSLGFYAQYVSLVDEIEQRFRVTDWKSQDVDIWPLARMDLYLDMYWNAAAAAPPREAPFALRAASLLARPLINRWKCRSDLDHYVSRPSPAAAILLGDGFSLDWRGGGWQDRFGEPIMAELEKTSARTFLMQQGDLSRLPWQRPTYPANLIERRGRFRTRVRVPPELPDHDLVSKFLSDHGVAAPSLDPANLARRAAAVHANASVLEDVLAIVQPRIAFVIGYFAGLGPAFMLACRRRRILSVDVQRSPFAGSPMAYGWSALPERGYGLLPAIFWSWIDGEAARVRSSTGKPSRPWHRTISGGHTQIAGHGTSFQEWDVQFRAVAGDATCAREILVALQPIAGHRATWQALAAQIDAAPPSWRWWIRRHPSTRDYQDVEFGRLLSLQRPNVVIDEASNLPLPVLLRHMTAVVSLASGAAAEGAMFGVPAFFLSEEARAPFSGLIGTKAARVVNAGALTGEIEALRPAPAARDAPNQPAIGSTLRQLELLAEAYRSGDPP